ncbi:MAG: methylenetetrahydrofolate reductase [Actinomycetota bacterium]
MTRIDTLLAAGRTVSFEFFPPKTDDGEVALRRTLDELAPLEPSFVSITYGAGGSTRERTHRLVVDLLQHSSMLPMAHLTAVSHTREELRDIIARYRDAGVHNLLALRGDPPRDAEEVFFDLEHAWQLVELAREVGGDAFSVGVAAHPAGHPSAPDLATDRKHLAAKLALADLAVTQFFFGPEEYERLVDDLAGLGCHKPVLPGIMPITNIRQIQRFAELSGTEVPRRLVERFVALGDDEVAVRSLGIELATELCQELLDAGAPGLHFYTLNRSTATREIHANLGFARDRSAP